MITNKLKLSLATAVVVAGVSANAGKVIAPNIDEITIGGDVELKHMQEKTDTAKVSKRTAEVNLNIDAKAKNGISVHTSFTAYDDTQAKAGASTGLSTTEAYAVIPFSKVKLVAGLAENGVYGTDAFENGGESWKVVASMPITQDVKVGFASKILNEEEADSNKGDSGETALRVDGSINGFMAGVKLVSGYTNKNDGQTPTVVTDKETEYDTLTGYVTGTVSDIDLGFEYQSKDVTMVGATTQPSKQSGYFVSASKGFGNTTAGLSYISLSKGLSGGGDFAPGLILDGNVASSETKDTTAIVVPVDFKINDQLSANVTLISADIQGKDGTETDASLTYGMNENVSFGLNYGKFDGDAGCVIGDQTNVELAVNVTF
jgi:hypothetical protein